jgi:uncharacterized protein (DUF2384 family)
MEPQPAVKRLREKVALYPSYEAAAKDLSESTGRAWTRASLWQWAQGVYQPGIKARHALERPPRQPGHQANGRAFRQGWC